MNNQTKTILAIAALLILAILAYNTMLAPKPGEQLNASNNSPAATAQQAASSAANSATQAANSAAQATSSAAQATAQQASEAVDAAAAKMGQTPAPASTPASE